MKDVEILDDLVAFVKPVFPDAVPDAIDFSEKILNGTTKKFEGEDRLLMKSVIANSFIYGIFYVLNKKTKVVSDEKADKTL